MQQGLLALRTWSTENAHSKGVGHRHTLICILATSEQFPIDRIGCYEMDVTNFRFKLKGSKWVRSVSIISFFGSNETILRPASYPKVAGLHSLIAECVVLEMKEKSRIRALAHCRFLTDRLSHEISRDPRICQTTSSPHSKRAGMLGRIVQLTKVANAPSYRRLMSKP